jgi:MFS family permease
MKLAPRVAWALVLLLWVVALLNYLDRQIVFSIFPVLRADLGMNDAELGLVSSSFLLVYGAVSLFAGLLAVRWGIPRTILLSLAIWSAVTLLTGAVRTPAQMIAVRGLMGFSEALYIPAALALVAAIHGERTRARATALHQSGIYIGIIAGGTLGGWFAEHWGWRYGFVLLGGVGLAYSVLLGGAFRGIVPAAPRASPPVFGELRRVQGFGALLAVFCLFSAAGWIVLTWMPLYLYEHFHMTLVEAGFAATFYLNLGSFSGIFSGGWLSDRLALHRPRARVYVPAAGFVCSGVFLAAAAATSSAPVLFTALALFGFGRGFFDCNVMPLLCLMAPVSLRAPGYGVFNCGGCLTGAVMTALAGVLKSRFGLAGSIEASAAGLLLAAAILMWGMPGAGRTR